MSEIRTPLRIAAFVLALAVAFAGAVGVGRAVGPLDIEPGPDHGVSTPSDHQGDGHDD